jgi:hypothetical protein
MNAHFSLRLSTSFTAPKSVFVGRVSLRTLALGARVST